MFRKKLSLCAGFAQLAYAKNALVFLGATGDNALRPSGVWSGLFEAFAGGVFSTDTVGIHVAMNTPHTVDELHKDVIEALTPLYAELQNNTGWKCLAPSKDCKPKTFLKDVSTNIWAGRDADAQAANMTAALKDYDRVTVYLSVPPSVFASWSKAAVDNWGKERVHLAAEIPFGSSLANANILQKAILDAGVPEGNLHLVDHWLSFFMNRHLPDFRKILEPRLGIQFNNKDISKIVVTEYEGRDLAGRGGYFDRVGQVRDMVQSHLLQVLALLLMESSGISSSDAKFSILNQTSLGACRQSQYEGWLLEPKLTYHPGFADSTYCEVHLKVSGNSWRSVDVTIQTGKLMGETMYTIEVFQNNTRGVLRYDIGKEETGVGAISVTNWPIKDQSPFQVPGPGFNSTESAITMSSSVNTNGTGCILNYSQPNLYFPKPYSMMVAALLKANYSEAFVSYKECRKSWEIVNASSGSCLDPAPANVAVYQAPQNCNNTPPAVCWKEETVADLYDVTYKCSAANDKLFKNISFYQAKCHPAQTLFQHTSEVLDAVIV